jgi:hypothetical protein
MRIQTLLTFVAAGLFIAGSVPVQAQDWERAHRIINKTMEDLHRIEHRDVWAAPDRGHYEAAERNLNDVRKDLDGNRLDRGRLDSTISEIEYITHVDGLDRRAREVLNEDARELHRLRDDWRWR